jgi:DNA-binding transcriptional ArsR family regulator
MSEPRRLAILNAVVEKELAAGEIHRRMRDVSFGAVSQHLHILQEAGLVSVRRQGRFRLYRAKHETLRALRDWLDEMWGDALDDLRRLAEEEER